MGLIIIRTIIVFITLVFIMRLMGKRQIGEMQPYELVITLVIADLACIPMADSSIPLLYGIIAVGTIFLLHQIVVLLEQNNVIKNYISGRPAVVINKNGIDIEELRSNSLDVSDLLESIRMAGYFALDDINYAIFESTGNLSVFPAENINSKSFPIIIIDQGKFIKENLDICKMSKETFINIIKEKGASNLKRVLVLTIDGEGKVYMQIKDKKYITFKVDLPEGVKW